MQENKKKMISLGVTVMTLLLIVVGATYAYFQAQIDTGKSTDVDITAESVDSLTFTTGNPISFSITQDNFKQGGNNLSGGTTATASLIAGKDRTATYNYNIYLNIAANNFIYTKDTNTPELLLKVTGPNGEVTSINGLTYNSTLKGFDITSISGQIKIVDNYEISTTGTKTDNWTVEIIFRNLDSDQTANSGKMVRAELLIEKEESSFSPTLADVCREGDNLANCIKAFADSNTYEVTKIIKHDGTYANDAGDNNYRYSGGDGSSELDTTLFGSVTAMGNTFYYYLDDFEQSYIDQIVSILEKNEAGETLTSEEQAILIDFNTKVNDGTYVGFQTIEAAMADAVKKGLIESPIKNYVCFGSDEEICPNDDLYRIIGVFGDQVKLIKADYANSNMLGTDGDYNTNTFSKSDYSTYKGSHTTINRYYWNYKAGNTASNNWETSLLNKTNLNINYITYLNNKDAKWVNMIADTNWNIGGHTTSDDIAKTFYDAEKTKQTSEASKIGLMYPSDYGYATLPSNWNTNISSYGTTTTIRDNNWMYMGLDEWTITPHSSHSSYAFYVRSIGYLDNYTASNGYEGRPVLYLKADVTYVKGKGSASEPLRIN